MIRPRPVLVDMDPAAAMTTRTLAEARPPVEDMDPVAAMTRIATGVIVALEMMRMALVAAALRVLGTEAVGRLVEMSMGFRARTRMEVADEEGIMTSVLLGT